MASRMAARVMKVCRALARFSIAAARNLFTTDVPVNFAVCHDGTRWVVTRVIVEDTDVDLDMKHVRAYDPVWPSSPLFNALKGGDWPAWEFGS